MSDIATLSLKSKQNTIGMGLTIGHDGSVYWYTKPLTKIPASANLTYGKRIQNYARMGYNEVESQELALMDYAMQYGFKFGKVETSD